MSSLYIQDNTYKTDFAVAQEVTDYIGETTVIYIQLWDLCNINI